PGGRAATRCRRPRSRSASVAGRETVTTAPASAGGAPARGAGRQANPAPARVDTSSRRSVASIALIPKIVRVNLLRRHPIALALVALVLLSAFASLPAVVDAVSGTPPPDADLVRPAAYTLTAPLSNALDALTFLSLERARAFLIAWMGILAVWGFVRPGGGSSLLRRLACAALGALIVPLGGVAAVLLPRPVPPLVTAASPVTVLDYHAHPA